MTKLEAWSHQGRYLQLGLLCGVVACGVALAAACAPTPPAAKPAPASPAAKAPAVKGPLDVVKRGNLRGITFGAAVAKGRGYFEEVGIDEQEIIFGSGAEQTQALAAGDTDMGNTSMTAGAFNILGRGVNQRFVADNWRYELGSRANMIVVRPDLVDTFKQPSDLRGRTVVIQNPLKDGGDFFALKKMFDTVGMTVDDVKFERVFYPDMLVALANKSAEAAVMIEPFITRGQQDNVLVPWLEHARYDPGGQIATLVYSEKFIRERPDVARRWMVANLRGTRDYEDFRKGKQREVVAPILAKHTGLPEEVVLKMGFPSINPDGYLNAEWIIAAQRQLQEWGLVNQIVPQEQVVDHQFVDYAIQQLGRYGG